MQTSDNQCASKMNHRKVQASTTLNRRYTKRPTRTADVMVRRVAKNENATKVAKSPLIRKFSAPKIQQTQQVSQNDEPVAAAVKHPLQSAANARMQTRAAEMQKAAAPMASKISAKELKDQAIKKALAQAEHMEAQPEKKSKKVVTGMQFGFGRVMLALSCAAAAVFAIVYFVNLNMPDISLKVAAMQTGMDPTYPNYVPRDYSVSSITSEDGKIAIEFSNSGVGTSFSLVEEKSSWDTNALVSNFVKSEYGENYTIVREQGLSLYISGSNAAWVNGGIVYKIKADDGVLTNKQIRAIATSL